MKIFSFTLTLLLSAALLSAGQAPTSFTFQFQNADGSYNTNYTTMQGWPAAVGGVVVVSNTVVWSGPSQLVTNQFAGTNTLGTNSAMPNSYRVFCPATGLGFTVAIPQTTNLLPLANYVTGSPVTYPSSSLYFYVTNSLGFQPLASNLPAALALLGFQPATNAGPVAYSQLPFTPPSNNYVGVSNALAFVVATNGGPLAYSQLPFTPPTNSFSGLTNVLGFAPLASNWPALLGAAGFQPATNPPAGYAFTGSLGYTISAGARATLLVTNGVVATNTVP